MTGLRQGIGLRRIRRPDSVRFRSRQCWSKIEREVYDEAVEAFQRQRTQVLTRLQTKTEELDRHLATP